MRKLNYANLLGTLALATSSVLLAWACSSDHQSAAASSCPADQSVCENVCVDLQTNGVNCGVCGRACGATESCSAGTCSCGTAYTSCSGRCVNLSNDPNYCGACGNACGSSLVCSNGTCASDCVGGETNCDRACVDVTSNALHCGACGNACASGQSCVDGECACGDSGRLCGGSCVNIASDPSNCGGCARRCGSNEMCKSGVCESAPPVTPVVTASCTESFSEAKTCSGTVAGKTYYVSTSGSDSSSGLSETTPLKSLAAVNALALAPGDKVLFHCGDLWRNENLIIARNGAACQHIVFGSYPAACANQPRFSGSYPITGWTRGTDGVWSASLGTGANAGHFPKGINQLFSGEQRLPLGRWPNRGDANYPGGYSRIVSHNGTTLVGDPKLPSGDWSGAVFHHFSIRWLLLNSEVRSSGSGTLTLATPIDCYDGCGDPNPSNAGDFGWGYFLANHRLTLDQQGEWYYEKGTNAVYLVSGTEPTAIEGSVVAADVVDAKDPGNDEGFHGLVDLGANAGAPIHHVVVENLRLENSWRDGIGTPINPTAEYADLTIRCNTVRNPDSKGINLASWAIDASDWRGGQRITVVSNVIDGPNHFGVRSLARESVFQDNLIANVGLIDNLSPSGLGCQFGNGGCTENGSGLLLERFDESHIGSTNVTVRRNRFQRVGHCGIYTLGVATFIEENVLDETCYSKGDCGAISTYSVPNIVIRRNIVRDVISPIEGFSSTYHERFGFGLYVDVNTTGNSEGNTIARTQGYGILYQTSSSGNVTGNTIYGVNVDGGGGRSLLYVAGSGTVVGQLTENILVATNQMRLLFTEADGQITTSNNNHFIQPYTDDYIYMQTAEWVPMNLATWRTFSGQDANSVAGWFTLAEGAAPITELFVNDTAVAKTITLTRSYVDLDRKAVAGTITLEPFTSRVLVGQ